MFLTISLVSYNNFEVLARTLRSLLAHIPAGLSFEIIVVDNASSQPIREALQEFLPNKNIRFVLSPKNLGYGGGHNLAIKSATSHYHLISNPDILLTHDVFSPLIQLLEANPNFGLAAPKILNEDGSLQYTNRRLPSLFDIVLRRLIPTSLKFLFKNRYDRYEMLDVGYDQQYEVPFLSGCFLLCRTEVLQSLGGFDERYFMYFEDVDLCRKFRSVNYQTMYCPAVSVTHLWQRASKKSFKMLGIHLRSAWAYFNKWGWKIW